MVSEEVEVMSVAQRGHVVGDGRHLPGELDAHRVRVYLALEEDVVVGIASDDQHRHQNQCEIPPP